MVKNGFAHVGIYFKNIVQQNNFVWAKDIGGGAYKISYSGFI